eukprot:1384769-Amorphochlora_amoeboformis.AAC.1
MGQVYSWGSNSYGQIGTGSTNTRENPREWSQNVLNNTNIVHLTCGVRFTLALSDAGNVYRVGQLGNDTKYYPTLLK